MNKKSFKDSIKPPKKTSSIKLPPPLFVVKPPAGSPVKNPFKDFSDKAGTPEMAEILKKMSKKGKK